MHSTWFIGGILLVVVACAGDPTTSVITQSDEPIQTDSSLYHAHPLTPASESQQYGFTMVAAFRNTTDQPIYLERCSEPLYRFATQGTSDGEVAAYTPLWGCPQSDPFSVGPGEVRVDTFHVAGPNLWGGRPREGVGILEGRFRISYDAYFQSMAEDGTVERTPVPDSVVLSNEFVVQLAERPR